jgi:hypothetical protein
MPGDAKSTKPALATTTPITHKTPSTPTSLPSAYCLQRQSANSNNYIQNKSNKNNLKTNSVNNASHDINGNDSDYNNATTTTTPPTTRRQRL